MHPLREQIAAAELELERLSAERDRTLLEGVLWDGWTYRQAAEVFGISPQRVHQLVKRYREQHAHIKALTPAQELSRARDAFQNARHAQELRAETASGGNAREERAFYGAADESTPDQVETRISGRLSDWHEGQDRARLRYESA